VGHHACAAYLQDLVDYNDAGFPLVAGDGVIPISRLQNARGAEADCPEMAITLDEDD
jgi:ferredoxin